ncbi:MAG: UDP-N-acetylmuramoylalanyl-D-glutamyl-2, 6-diaminopimelate--D-alanyl-D-alanine ligase, partial [Pseudomonadota bacterium]
TPEGEGRRIAVLGEMKELGPTSPDLHAGLLNPILAAGVQKLYLAGPDMAFLKDQLPDGFAHVYQPHANELQNALMQDLTDGDIFLFKGSNASGIGNLLKLFLAKTNEAG